jgi:hypothetical protein
MEIRMERGRFLARSFTLFEQDGSAEGGHALLGQNVCCVEIKIGMPGGLRQSGRTPAPLCHFPLSRKRFMVPLCFAIGKHKISINIKGLIHP